MGNSQHCTPQLFFGLIVVRCMLTHGPAMMDLRQRHALMMQGSIQTLLDFYKPLLIALFEYYLYESYSSENITNV